jgi:signal transduction histidine kinase
MQGLRPEVLEHRPLATGLQQVVENWSAAGPVKAEFVVTGDSQPLPGELEIVLLRVTQEALSNIRKHASANRVRVTLSFLLESIRLDVRDDGTGFDPHDSSLRGFGLTGMRERVAEVGGTLEIESDSGLGTALVVTLPVKSRSATRPSLA